MTHQTQLPVEATFNITKQPMDAWVTHKLTKDTPWVADLLKEMNENGTTKTPEQWLQETNLDIELKWIKHFKGEMGEYLLVKMELHSFYATECVTTLTPMRMALDFSVSAAFVSEKIAESEEYKETSEIWLNGETWELYTHKRNMVELSEMIHEQIYLNYDYYPRIDAAPSIEMPLAPDEEQ
jgi:hypothetical protein